MLASAVPRQQKEGTWKFATQERARHLAHCPRNSLLVLAAKPQGNSRTQRWTLLWLGRGQVARSHQKAWCPPLSLPMLAWREWRVALAQHLLSLAVGLSRLCP